MNRIISPELSALGIRKAPSPVLPRVFAVIKKMCIKNNPLVVDHGCGQLRNINSLLQFSKRLVLVDTERQITKKHKFFAKDINIRDYIKMKYKQKNIKVLNEKEFDNFQANADFIFSINVLDVVPPKTRGIILEAIKDNLADKGILVLIIPRNDTWTIRRCTPKNRYADGYIFANRGGFTFYKNWCDQSIQALIKRHGYKVICDLTTYKYVCILCRIQKN